MSLSSAAATAVATTMATLTTTGATATATDVTATPTPTPDYSQDHHHHPTDSRRGVIIGVISFILPFTAAVVALRFYTRHYLSRAVGADDWMMLVSLILAIVDGATMLMMTTQGLGRHMWTVTPEAVKSYNMYFYLSIVFYYSCLGTVKTAILLQYLRVFAVKMRKITIVALVLIGLWSTALVLVSIFACRPIRGFWDHDVPATCVPDLPQWYVNAAGNIATDVIIFTLPIPVLWHLNLPRSQRLSLIGIFCLGFFTCTISVIRITFLNLNGDDTYANVAAACWSIGELCCAIVCSCLPTLRPVFFRLLPGTLRHNHNRHSSPHQRSSNNNGRQSVYVRGASDRGLGSPDSEGYRLKSVRSPSAQGSPLPILGYLEDGVTEEDGIRNGKRGTARNHDGGRGGANSYYNRFYHHFHPHDSGVVAPSDSQRTTTTTSKAGISFTTTSRLRSNSSTSGDDSDSDLERYMNAHSAAAGRDYDRQHEDPEKRAIAAAAAASAATSTVAAPAPTALPSTPSRRSLRDLMIAGTPRVYRSSRRSSRSNSPRPLPQGQSGSGRRGNFYNSSSSESLSQAAQADSRGNSNNDITALHDAAAGISFFKSDDEDDDAKNKSRGGKSSASSPSSSSAPTRAHSPSPTPPRSYSYSHLRRMAAAVGAGVGAAVGGLGGSNNNKSANGNNGTGTASHPLNAPAIAPTTALNPGDPLAMDRDAYLGLRQGTVTSIEAGRPSTAEAEAAGWELPTGPGIQIRREVAQNVESA